MDAELARRIGEALSAACRPDDAPEIHLETTPGDRIGGYVVSTRFAGLSPAERQDAIWDKLDAALTVTERRRISFLMTETREEHDVLAEARAAG